MSSKVGPTYPTLFLGVSGGSSVSGVSGVAGVSASEYNLRLDHVGFLFNPMLPCGSAGSESVVR